MTKVIRLLRAVLVALTVISVVLGTEGVASAIPYCVKHPLKCGKQGADKVKAGAKKAKDTAEEAVDKVKKGADKVKEVADKTKLFEAHKERFQKDSSWRDFFGRTPQAWLFHHPLWASLVLPIWAWRRRKFSLAGVFLWPVTTYALSAGATYAYELFRQSGQFDEACVWAQRGVFVLFALGILINALILVPEYVAARKRGQTAWSFVKTIVVIPPKGAKKGLKKAGKKAEEDEEEDAPPKAGKPKASSASKPGKPGSRRPRPNPAASPAARTCSDCGRSIPQGDACCTTCGGEPNK